MNKQTITVLILILALAGSLAFIYFNHILPNREQAIEYVNLSVSAIHGRERIPIKVQINGDLYNLSKGYELIQVPKNYETTIKNINTDEIFYEREKKINFTENSRYDIVLEKPEELEFEIIKKQPIEIKIEGNLEDPFVCLIYSQAYIFVSLENETKTDNPERFKKWDKCYKPENITNLKIKYTIFSQVQDSDYINLSVGIDKYQEIDKIIKIS